MAEHYPTKSVAVLAEQGKVTGWKQPESNASQLASGVGDEINALGDAQVVTTNKPGFVPKPEDPLELQKGPKKKYLDGGSNQNGNATEETGFGGSGSGGDGAGMDSFFDATDATDATHTVSFAASTKDTNANNGGNNDMGNFFDDMDDNNALSANDASNNNYNNTNRNATMIALPNVENEDEDEDEDDNDRDPNNDNNYGNNISYDESKQQESSVLSMWEAERRKILEEKAKKEKEAQREIELQAQKDTEEFFSNRNERIAKAKENALAREKDIKLDYESVYKNGTIWEQVAKLVDLSNTDDSVKRMRDLIIDLKNNAQK